MTECYALLPPSGQVVLPEMEGHNKQQQQQMLTNPIFTEVALRLT